MTNATILGVFCTHAQKEYGKVWEMKSTPILNILVLLLFLKLVMNYSKFGLNGTQYKDVKWGMGVESARFHGIVWIALKRILLPSMHILLPNYTDFKNIRAIWKFNVINHIN